MVIKVEIYYEVLSKGGEVIPPDIKTKLNKLVWDDVSNNFSLKSDFWKGDLLTAKKMTNEQIHEKIRTAK
jgi:hypothetical protein